MSAWSILFTYNLMGALYRWIYILYFLHIEEYFYNQYIHENMREHLQMYVHEK